MVSLLQLAKIIKYTPIIYFFVTNLNLTLLHYGIITPFVVSWSFVLLLIILSFGFKFCYQHRLSLYSVLLLDFLKYFNVQYLFITGWVLYIIIISITLLHVWKT